MIIETRAGLEVEAQRRQRRQRWLLALLFFTSLTTFLDRVNISIVGGAIAREYGLDPVRLGTIFSAFVAGYTLCQIPGGWLGDRYGHARVLAAALVWWSVCTALTAWAGSGALASLVGTVGALWIVRFLIGVGEAAAYPCANGVIAEWFPPHARALPTGLMFAGVGVGSAITPPLIAVVMVHFGWRTAFVACAPIGIVIAILLLRTVRTGGPGPTVPTERPVDTPLRLGELSRNRQLWCLTAGMFCFGYVSYVYYTWFYLYLVDIRGFSTLRGSLLGALPFVGIAAGSTMGGWLSDRWLPRVGKARARRRVATIGLSTAAILMPAGAIVANAYVAVGALSIAAGAAFLAVTQYWTTAVEIVPTHAATVSGIMNTGSSVGGVLSPIVTPWVGEHYGWAWALSMPALFSALAALLWQVTTPNERRDGVA